MKLRFTRRTIQIQMLCTSGFNPNNMSSQTRICMKEDLEFGSNIQGYAHTPFKRGSKTGENFQYQQNQTK